MSTAYIYSILLLYPQSRYDEIETWYQSQFPNAGSLLTPVGEKNGEQWFSSHFVATKNDVEKWLEVFGHNLGVEIPTGFVDLPRSQQMQWIEGMQQAAIENLGIYVAGAWNDEGQLCDLDEALLVMSVTKTISGEV